MHFTVQVFSARYMSSSLRRNMPQEQEIMVDAERQQLTIYSPDIATGTTTDFFTILIQSYSRHKSISTAVIAKHLGISAQFLAEISTLTPEWIVNFGAIIEAMELSQRPRDIQDIMRGGVYGLVDAMLQYSKSHSLSMAKLARKAGIRYSTFNKSSIIQSTRYKYFFLLLSCLGVTENITLIEKLITSIPSIRDLSKKDITPTPPIKAALTEKEIVDEVCTRMEDYEKKPLLLLSRGHFRHLYTNTYLFETTMEAILAGRSRWFFIPQHFSHYGKEMLECVKTRSIRAIRSGRVRIFIAPESIFISDNMYFDAEVAPRVRTKEHLMYQYLTGVVATLDTHYKSGTKHIEVDEFYELILRT